MLPGFEHHIAATGRQAIHNGGGGLETQLARPVMEDRHADDHLGCRQGSHRLRRDFKPQEIGIPNIIDRR